MDSKEVKELQGRLDGQEVKSTGVKVNDKGENEPWTCYSYKVGKNYFSGFINFGMLLGKYVIVSYTEKPNPKNKTYPFKNIVNIVEGVAPENAEAVTEETVSSEVNYHDGAFFGMCSNQTLRVILHKNGDIKSSWDNVFDEIWELNSKKRKEKLG